MATPFTNVHAHVFDSGCAPDRFLRVIPSGFVRKFSGFFKNVFESKMGRITVHRLSAIFQNRNSRTRKAIERYVAFLEIGLEKSQINIFQKTLETGLRYDSSVRIVGLTMNMDFMDSTPSVNMKSFSTQLAEVMRIKEFYPENFFPFLGVDPRHLSGQALADWADSYFTKGFSHEGNIYPYFYGIKLYPALGFFPFDPRLTELYAYAQEHNIPIMTHCTRGGSQYIGAAIESLIPPQPDFLIPTPPNNNATNAKASIIKRINSYYTKGWIQNSKLGDNDLACDLFSHPENYIPILEAFPKLKICLAHLGGSGEVKPVNEDLKEIREIDPVSWFQRICDMMSQYENLYTDISYTLSDLDQDDILDEVANKLLANKNLASRVLFGTDFFMVEQEKREAALYDLTKEKLNLNDFNNLTRTNPQKYLMV